MNQALIFYNLPMLFPFIRSNPKREYGNATLVCAVQQGGKIACVPVEQFVILSIYTFMSSTILYMY